MSAKTKIVVLRMKEIIYTAIFIGFALLLILLFFIMFRPKKETPSLSEPSAETPVSSGGAASAGASDVSSPLYNPGLYSSPIVLGSQNVNVEVTVSSDQITSVSLVPLSDSIATMYPLMQPAMDSLSEQIVANQSLEGLDYPAGSQYTSMALMNAIKTALNKAVLEQTASTDT